MNKSVEEFFKNRPTYDKYNSLKLIVANNTMKVNIKKLHKDAVIPKYSNVGDAGMDLTAINVRYDNLGNVCYGTGIAMEIPEGYVGLIFPRSSVSKKTLSLANSVGVIDSGYRGEIIFKFKPTAYFTEQIGELAEESYQYDAGERIGQIMILPYPQIEFNEVTKFEDTERGTDGFGSTGN